jgi:hypothetical protein
MVDDWVSRAQDRLLSLRIAETGWSDQLASPPRVEPTALACLGLLAIASEATPTAAAVRSSAGWLGSFQNADGSLGVSPELRSPCWSTPYAILVWAALKSEDRRLSLAVDWLLAQKGTALEPSTDIPTGHDPKLVGWPWADRTHSWLEPTASAVLALRAAGRLGHARVQEGLRLIRDRAIRSGGWNYGNSSVFDRELRPQPAATGLALLAVAGLGDRAPREERALGYLRAALPGTRSAQALCWGLLSLKAWGERPADADQWLAESFSQVVGMRNPARRLASLLLARGDRSLTLLGVTGREGAP